MSFRIRPVQFYTTTIPGSPDNAYLLLTGLAGAGVNLLAFTAIPVGLGATQVVFSPEDAASLANAAPRLGLTLASPDEAFLVQGDDELGALARVHDQLAAAGVHPYASTGISDGRGGFGYVLYTRRGESAAAKRALGL
jgi:hypothetical protein